MSQADDQQADPKPTELRGGAPPGEQEGQEKGSWAAKADQGVVPAELGGSDAPEELQADDPELGSPVQGQPAQSDEPATESGIDPSGGDSADATSQGGPDATGGSDAPAGTEPDLKDAAAGPRQADLDSAN